MSEGYTNPEGTPTSSNYDPKTGMVTAPGGGMANYGDLDQNAFPSAKTPFGALDRNAFKTPPLGLGVTPSMYSDYDNSRTSTFNQHVTVNGVQDPHAVADAVKASATRGAADLLRNGQGRVQ